MSEQWKRCESRYYGYQCQRQDGHDGRHLNQGMQWGQR